MPDEPAAKEFHVEDHPDPADINVLETQIRREASAAMGLGGITAVDTPMRGCDSVTVAAGDLFVIETPAGGEYGA